MRKRMILGMLVAVLFLIAVPISSPANSNNWKTMWSLDYNDSWTEMSPVVAPPGRVDSPLAFDSKSDVVIVFGGLRGPDLPAHGDTWAYSYENDEWTNMSPTVAPDVRGAHLIVYDSESDRVILFGGLIRVDEGPSHVCFNDTWAYNHNNNTWTNMQPTTAPTARVYPAIGYDQESDRVILFGGILEGTTIAADTWAYDYNTNTWENMNPPSQPSTRFAAAMVYNSAADKMILNGGASGATGWYTDTWSYDYDTNTWINLNPSEPPEDSAMFMTYDVEDDICIFFGEGDENAKTKIYDYNSNTWTSLTHSTHPPGRVRSPLAYDVNSDVTILFGGMTGWYENRLND
ncbi:MAG: kelch repeat-containing protein, partial [Candidatus Thorarchaeota archaeon]